MSGGRFDTLLSSSASPTWRSHRTPCIGGRSSRRFVALSFARRREIGGTRRPFTVRCESNDFVYRVLKENPSQVEPRFLIGGKLYTLREKEMLRKNVDSGLVEFIRKKLNFKDRVCKGSSESGGVDAKGGGEEPVLLSNLLREYKGKLYVPEPVFGKGLSEEEEFDRCLEELPGLGFEDFMKAVKSDKVKLLTSKEVVGMPSGNWRRNFVVDLKEIPGDKSLHRTKWVLN